MLPGPTPDPFEMLNSEPRYCPEPCPQECAPGCYDWCCYPSIQVPPPPMQLMMVPVNLSRPAPPPVPAPLPYPMDYGPSDACHPNPCPAKKHEVTKNTTVIAAHFAKQHAAVSSTNKNSKPIEITSKSSKKLTSDSKKSDSYGIVKNPIESVSVIPKKATSSPVAANNKEDVKLSKQQHVSKFTEDSAASNDFDPEMV